MKRFLMFLLIIVSLLIGALTSLGYGKDMINIKDSNEKGDCLCLDLGFILEKQENKQVKKYYKNDKVVGECLTICAKERELNKICDELGITILKKYTIEDFYIIEGYSLLLRYKIDGRRSNVQIAVKKNEITIASPIIYGSY